MTTKQKILIATILALIVIGVVALWYFSAVGQYRLSLGKRYAYHLTYHHTARSTIALPGVEAQSNSGEMDCEMKWDMVPLRFDEGIYTIAVFPALAGDCRFIFNDKDLLDDAAFRERVFTDKYAVIRMDNKGTIRGLAFRKNEDALFKGFIKLIISDLQFSLPGGFAANWRTEEQDRYGRYAADYSRNGWRFLSNDIEKKKERYLTLTAIPGKIDAMKQTVTGALAAHLSGRGHLETLNGTVTAAVDGADGRRALDVSSVITLRLTGITKFKEIPPMTDAGSLDDSPLTRIDVDDRAIRKIWEQRASSLTIPEMAGLLRRYALSGETGDGGALAWRIVAYLKLHPERCKELVPLFTDEQMTTKGRVFIYGLLVGTGHAEAQQAMRDLLGTEAAQKEAMYSIYMQQFSQLEKPDAATAGFMEGLYAKAKKEGRYRSSTILTLGALAGKLSKTGEDALAGKFNKMLTEELQAAKNPREKEQLLDGLGNAGFSSNVALIQKFVGDDNQRVRATVPMALRKTQTPETEKLVMSLVRDDDSLVQKQALTTLSHYALTHEHLTDLRDQLKAGKVTESSYFELLNLVSRYPQERAVTQEMLLEMKKRVSNNPHLEARINQMLGQ
ncbi:MAG TPA: HEAT repeat domain-containing protein [bacterium]|nr:HEAT repeat domain-containing protein [bacterium]